MSGLYALLIIPMIGIFVILSFDSYNFNIVSNNSNSGSFNGTGTGNSSGVSLMSHEGGDTTLDVLIQSKKSLNISTKKGEILKAPVINKELNFYKKR